jgi:hypothetical protein
MPDKPNFALLIGKKGPAGDADHEKDLAGSSEMTKERAERSALQDVITAVKVGDVAGLSTALKDFLSSCYPELGGDDESSEPAPDEEGPPPDMEE